MKKVKRMYQVTLSTFKGVKTKCQNTTRIYIFADTEKEAYKILEKNETVIIASFDDFDIDDVNGMIYINDAMLGYFDENDDFIEDENGYCLAGYNSWGNLVTTNAPDRDYVILR